MNDPADNKPPSFWQMLHSVMAAAFGVQSGKNRTRDFSHGKASHFLIMGAAIYLGVCLDPVRDRHAGGSSGGGLGRQIGSAYLSAGHAKAWGGHAQRWHC